MHCFHGSGDWIRTGDTSGMNRLFFDVFTHQYLLYVSRKNGPFPVDVGQLLDSIIYETRKKAPALSSRSLFLFIGKRRPQHEQIL